MLSIAGAAAWVLPPVVTPNYQLLDRALVRLLRGTLEDPVAGIGFLPLAVSLTVIADAEGEH